MHQTEYIFARQGDSEQGAEVECTGESLSGKNIEKWEKPAECCKVSRVIGDKDRSLKQVPCHPAMPPTRLSGAGHSYFHHGCEITEHTARPSLCTPWTEPNWASACVVTGLERVDPITELSAAL